MKIDHYIIKKVLSGEFKYATKDDLKHSIIQYNRGLDYYRKRIESISFINYSHILDAACGCGQWTNVLAEKNKFVTGLDINDGLLEIASRFTNESNNRNIQYYQGDLHYLPFKDEVFDVIFSYSALMYTKEDVVIKEFSRVLKLGGKIYICSDGPGWPIYKIIVQALRQGRLRSILGAARLFIRTTFYTILLKHYINKITFLRRKDIIRIFNRNKLHISYYGQDGHFGNNKGKIFQPLYGETFFGLPADFELIGYKIRE